MSRKASQRWPALTRLDTERRSCRGTGSTFVGAIAPAAFAEPNIGALFAWNCGCAANAVFALAVLVGATAWVSFTTATRVQVCTTHAIVGALMVPGSSFRPVR